MKYRSGLSADSRGFTLIELLVVIAVIGILASVVMASLNSARKKARNVRRSADIKQVITALNLGLNGGNDFPNGGANWFCISSACTGGWAGYGANSTVDGFLLANISKKPEDPVDSTRGYGGYLYYYNWTGNTGTDGVFPAGTVVHWLQEPPITPNICAPGRINSTGATYVACIAYVGL